MNHFALAQAIRLGSTITIQGFGHLFGMDDAHAEPLAACALGAAFLGTFGNPAGLIGLESPEDLLYEEYPVLAIRDTCPVCRRPDELGPLIAHLNDKHRWRRSAIADWIDTVSGSRYAPADA